MAFRTICVALLLSSLLIAGCGTVANLVKPGPVEGGKTPFGGVSQDVDCLKTTASGDFDLSKHPNSEAEQLPQVALMLLCAADLPFTLIGDVLTWPYTAAYSIINQPVPVPPVIQDPAGLPPQTSPSHVLPAPAEQPQVLPKPMEQP
jgi:uncharacterized protein YceK